MTQPGETEGYTVLDHVDSILEYSKEDFLDYCIANVEKVPEETLKKYIFDGSEPVILGEKDEEILNSKDIKLIKGNLIDIKKDYIRHDSELSRILIDLAKRKTIQYSHLWWLHCIIS